MTRLAVPAPLETVDLEMDDGATIRVRRHGNPDGTRMFLSNGNGFAADGYLPFWGPLLDRFEVLVFDFRNHGRNPPSDPANHHYAQMARDLETIHGEMTDRLGPRPTVGAFHSMSARAAMKHAVEIGWRWDALVLFDPPNVPPPDHALYPMMAGFEKKLAKWAAARQERFADPSELAGHYAESRTHRGWVAGAHELMARSVLRPEPAGEGWTLACPPALESSIYLAALTLDLWPASDAYGGPVKLVAADPVPAKPAPTALVNRALAREQGYAYVAVPGTGHMLQIEAPDACIRAVTTFLGEVGIEVG